MAQENAQPLNLNEKQYSAIMQARRWLPYTPAAADIAAAPRGVMTDTDTTVTIEDVDGEEIIIPTIAFEIRGEFSPTRVTAVGAGVVYLVY